jgi:class 3 adenylate cyclase
METVIIAGAAWIAASAICLWLNYRFYIFFKTSIKALLSNNKFVNTSLQSSSQGNHFQNFIAPLLGAYPEASMHNIAVLFTDVVGSTKYFKAYGDTRGREMLRRHHKIVIAIVEDYGGSLIKEVGDSVMAYFPDAFDALKASIKMQHKFDIHNKISELQDEIHIRIGVHCGKVIFEEKDIYGDVVNVASKLTNLASGDQILISQEVYELARDTSLANYELTNFWNRKNVPAGLTIYKVNWENATISEPDRVAILQLHFRANHDTEDIQKQYQDIWDNFILNKDSFLANKQESTHASPDGTLTISFKDSSIALNVAERLLEYLSQELTKKGIIEKPPIQMVIAKDTFQKGNLLPVKKSKINLDGFNPGDIYLSKSIYDDIKRSTFVKSLPPITNVQNPARKRVTRS